MGREQERTFEIEGKQIKESEIPQIFNLSHLLEDFKQAVHTLGKEKAIQKFTPLLRKQLITLIQEQVVLPISPRFLYEVKQKPDNSGIIVHDVDYLAQPDIVERAKEGWLFAAGKGKHGEIENTRYAEVFVRRYLLEYLQTQKLVDEHLAKDPVLALPILDQLHNSTQPIDFTDRNGKKVKAFAGNWYALAMPASDAHAGRGSYFNVYRLVVIPESNLEQVRYVVESQGYYHQLGWKTQVKKLLNVDQTDRFDLQKFDEEAIMMRIIRMSEAKNQLSPDQLLIKLGIQAGAWLLPLRIYLGQRRQRKQEQEIDTSVKAVLEVLQSESQLLKSHDQDQRLKIFFEAIGNPLLLNRKVPGKEIVKQYQEVLLPTGSRESYLLSLAGVIPSIFTKVGGFSACGLLSAGGGLFKAGTNGVNGFGGLSGMDGDLCIVCPNCNHISTNLNTCSNCRYKRGMPLGRISNALGPARKSQPTHHPSIRNSGGRNGAENSGIKIFGGFSGTSVESLFHFGPKSTASINDLLQLGST